MINHKMAHACVRVGSRSLSICFYGGEGRRICTKLCLLLCCLPFLHSLFYFYCFTFLLSKMLHQNAVAYADRPLLIPNRDKKKIPRTGVFFLFYPPPSILIFFPVNIISFCCSHAFPLRFRTFIICALMIYVFQPLFSLYIYSLFLF